MSALTLSLLGSLQIQRGDKLQSHLRARSAQALLVFLAVDARSQQRDFLVELLWPGMPPNYGRKNLRQSLYELRRAFPAAGFDEDGQPLPLVIADRQTISINPQAALAVDTTEFDRLIRSGAPQHLEQAVELYRGDFLADFYLPDSSTFEEWLSSRRASYRRQMLDALHSLADLALSSNDHEEAERFSRRQLALDDLQEPAVRQLMVALTNQGQRANALQTYGDLRARLRNALDVEPAVETTAVYKQIIEETLSHPLAAENTRSPEVQENSGITPHNLPAAVTPFVGRTKELTEIEDLLLSVDHRLLTLLGPGGIGKSRLALEAAGRLITSAQFPDGIWFVPLAAFEEMEQMVPAIAAPLPFDNLGSQEPESHLLEFLRDKKLLLVLDNMEQLLVSGPLQLLQRILTKASSVKILATSRAPLQLQGEQLYRLNGLTLPSSFPPSLTIAAEEWGRQFDALRLFESCAQRVDPDFSLDASNLEAILGIGQRVEGFPLGLEMAAAWIELLSPAEIERELAQSFDLLEAEWPSAGDRHHSARAVFEWSWRLLSGKERTLCQALSVFRGGFSREAALVVGQAALPTLLSLKRKSWLQQSANERFQLHELLRQYAEEKLRKDEKEQQAAAAAHAGYFVTYFKRLAQMTHGAQQKEAFAAVERDVDNARIAWHWLAEQGRYTEITRGLLPALFTSTIATGRITGIRALIPTARNRLPSADPGEEALTATLALNAAECKLLYEDLGGDIHGEVTLPWQLLKDTWEIIEQEPADFDSGPWAILVTTFYGWQQDREQGLRRLRDLVNYYRESGDRWLYAFSLQALGQLLSMQANQIFPADTAAITAEKEESRRKLDQALELFSALGDVLEQSRTLHLIGLLVQGKDPGTALVYFQKANLLVTGANLTTTRDYAPLALSYLSLGAYEEAFRIFAQAREYYQRQGNRNLLVGVMSLESMQALRYGDIDHARELRTACIKLHQELGHELNVIYGAYELGEIDRVSGQEESARWHYKEALTSFITLNNSFGQAFCKRGLGDLALLNADYLLARRHFETAISLAKKPFVHSWLTCLTHAKLARAALGLGDIEMATEHLELALRYANLRISGSNDLRLIALAEMAALLLAQNKVARALALSTFVANHAVSWHETKWRAEEIAAAAIADLEPSDRSAAEIQGQQLSLDDALALADRD